MNTAKGLPVQPYREGTPIHPETRRRGHLARATPADLSPAESTRSGPNERDGNVKSQTRENEEIVRNSQWRCMA